MDGDSTENDVVIAKMSDANGDNSNEKTISIEVRRMKVKS